MTSLVLTYNNNYGPTISDGPVTFTEVAPGSSTYSASGFTSLGPNCPQLNNLVSIDSASGVFLISMFYFNSCGSLTSVNLSGATIATFYTLTFGNCSSLSNFMWPQELLSIGDSAFANCNNLLNIVVPNSVTEIGSSAFQQSSITASNFLNYTINSNVIILPGTNDLNTQIPNYDLGNVRLYTDSITSAAAVYFQTFFPTVVIVAPDPICFKEGSKILTDKGYVAVQDLRNGDLVKTVSSGFKKIEHIGYSKMYHNVNETRSKDKLYRCSTSEYPELTEDLVVTGCHSILVKSFKDSEQMEKTQEVLGKIYITEKYYRLPACVDERTKIFEEEGVHTIWHFSLEHSDYYMNYGVYANGLLVETTSNRMMVELSGMTLV
jgi:hypothetical protein